MSEHHCHDGCECQRTDFWPDFSAMAVVAAERGVACPVTFAITTREVLDCANDGLWAMADSVSFGMEYTPSYGPAVHHRIRFRVGLTAQQFLRSFLHEVEHCLHCESFEHARQFQQDYDRSARDHSGNPDVYNENPWERAALAAEDDWESYSYLLNPMNGGTE